MRNACAGAAEVREGQLTGSHQLPQQPEDPRTCEGRLTHPTPTLQVSQQDTQEYLNQKGT